MLALHHNVTSNVTDELYAGVKFCNVAKTLNTDEWFDKLKSIRTKATQFHVACSKAFKAASLQTTTRKHYICQMQKNLIPNRLKQEVIEDNFAAKINADLCSQMLADTQKIVNKTQEHLSEGDKLVIAK